MRYWFVTHNNIEEIIPLAFQTPGTDYQDVIFYSNRLKRRVPKKSLISEEEVFKRITDWNFYHEKLDIEPPDIDDAICRLYRVYKVKHSI